MTKDDLDIVLFVLALITPPLAVTSSNLISWESHRKAIPWWSLAFWWLSMVCYLSITEDRIL
jgi:hypothetical protein